MVDDINQRKLEHLDITLNKPVEPMLGIYDKYSLPYKALPEINLTDVDTSTEFLGMKAAFPFIISSMTGGPAKAAVINKNIAIACNEMKIPFGLGSTRVILKKPESLSSFSVKPFAKNTMVFANIGLVQLNYGFGIKEIEKILKLTQVDGLFFHINPLQEAIQPEGDTNFSGLIDKLARIIKKMKVPVIIKEVGNGIDLQTAKSLVQIGVDWIDVAGVGGTSWSWIEGYRGNKRLGELFKAIGIKADEAIKQASSINKLNVIGGSGVRSGVDVAKVLMLGAKMATAAKPFLIPALTSPQKVIQLLESYKKELEISMFATGSSTINELRKLNLLS